MRAIGTERIREDQRIVISFEGRSIEARRGETVAAALSASGELALRETKRGERRGVFCGMGVCQECRVIVDGRHGVRACMTPITGPVAVSRHPPLAPSREASSASETVNALPPLAPELLVIGGGAAGLAAAAAAACAGVEVVLADERPTAGGQFYKQLAASPDLPSDRFADRQMQRGRDRVLRAAEAGVTMLQGAEVVAAFQPLHLLVKNLDGVRSVTPKRLIVATGAYERGFPVPGWTLPGVMTTGALQTLLRSYRVLPGKRIVIAGNGPLNLQVAIEAARAGAEVVAVVEAAAPRMGSSSMAFAGMLASSPALTLIGAALRSELALRRIPLISGARLRSIAKTPPDLAVELERTSRETADTLAADIVTMGYGFLPSNDVLRSLGCRFETETHHDWLFPRRDADGMTTVNGVYAAGDCARFGGAHVAEIEGTLAGMAVARSLGRKADGSGEQRLRRRLARHRRFQRVLWRLYADNGSGGNEVDTNAIACRCEELTFGDLAKAVEDGAAGVGTIKRATRAGMGPCQGRYCGSVGRAILRDRNEGATAEDGYWAPRPPVKPVAIADLIAGLRRDVS